MSFSDALFLEELDAPVDDGLVKLHVRDAVHEQAADPVVAFVDRHFVAGPVQLRRGGEAGRSAADDRDPKAGAGERRLGDDPALAESPFDDLGFDHLDGHGRLVDAERARAFTRRRADSPGELGEVVGLVEADDRLAPLAAIDQIVPLRDQVVDGAAQRQAVDQRAGVAVGDATVHATRALVAQRLLGVVRVRFAPVLDSLQRRADVGRLAFELHETGRLAHRQFPATRRASMTFSSKAAISASSCESPFSRIRACASMTRR
jgi:hypothetical protein